MLLGLISIILGVVTAIYLSANSGVSKVLGSPLAANLPFFFNALVTSAIILLVAGGTPTLKQWKQLPLHLYLPGVFSAVMIIGTTALVSRLGAKPFFVLLLAGQLVGALIVSQFGWFGSPPSSSGLKELLGVSLMAAGAAIALWH